MPDKMTLDEMEEIANDHRAPDGYYAMKARTGWPAVIRMAREATVYAEDAIRARLEADRKRDEWERQYQLVLGQKDEAVFDRDEQSERAEKAEAERDELQTELQRVVKYWENHTIEKNEALLKLMADNAALRQQLAEMVSLCERCPKVGQEVLEANTELARQVEELASVITRAYDADSPEAENMILLDWVLKNKAGQEASHD